MLLPREAEAAWPDREKHLAIHATNPCRLHVVIKSFGESVVCFSE
jgi:hypothetical protein